MQGFSSPISCGCGDLNETRSRSKPPFVAVGVFLIRQQYQPCAARVEQVSDLSMDFVVKTATARAAESFFQNNFPTSGLRQRHEGIHARCCFIEPSCTDRYRALLLEIQHKNDYNERSALMTESSYGGIFIRAIWKCFFRP